MCTLTHISDSDAMCWLASSKVTGVIAVSICDNFQLWHLRCLHLSDVDTRGTIWFHTSDVHVTFTCTWETLIIIPICCVFAGIWLYIGRPSGLGRDWAWGVWHCQQDVPLQQRHDHGCKGGWDTSQSRSRHPRLVARIAKRPGIHLSPCYFFVHFRISLSSDNLTPEF